MPPRTLLRYTQVRRLSEQPDVQASDSPFAEGRYFEASCLSSAVVNECVKVNGINGGGRPRVRRCDPNDALLMPMTGVIVEKISPQVCLVQVSGIVHTMTGIVPGEQYFVGPAGAPVTPAPTVPALQLVGIGLGDDKLLLFPNQITRGISSSDIYGEIPSGPVDGINRLFSLSSPIQAGTLRLFLNGVRLRGGSSYDYSILNPTQIELVYAPRIGDTLMADYRS